MTTTKPKRRRIREQREISGFGSLDGASKFVKGDAIAGLMITLINLFVGLAAGVFVHSMPVGEALETYSKLTIGDGLVSQVPSLITSMAAALLLSRGGATETTGPAVAAIDIGLACSAVGAGGMVLDRAGARMPTLIFSRSRPGFGAAAAIR